MNVPPMESVEKVLDEFLVSRQARGVSDRWLASLESMLCRFASAITKPVVEITPADCDRFLATLDVGPRGRNNAVAILKQFFRFAVRRRYAPPDFLPLSTLERSLVRAASVSLYTAEDLHKLLAVASAELRAVIALTAWCGVRSAEAQRLTWADIDLARGFVFVSAEKAKTASRRVCVIPACAKAVLVKVNDCPQRLSAAWPGTLHAHTWQFREAHRLSGVKAQRNGLRHSFISYRLAIVQDAAKVALEAGTSPQMIFSNYRELVTPEAAALWFAAQGGQLELAFAA